jgi:hypothetical protein
MVLVPLVGGALLLAAFLVHEARGEAPMLPLSLFRRRNFAVGNAQTFSMYGGLGLLFFFLVLYLQQVAGFSATEAGTTALPVTIVMFLLSARFGALADRYGPRLFMGLGPLISAAGLALTLPIDRDVDYVTELLPALIVFGIGLAVTVAPLTATVLADADEHNAGIASGVNNAIARVASLIAIAAVGALVSADFGDRLDRELGPLANEPRLQRAIDAAKERPLSVVEARGVSARAKERIETASADASVGSFRLGIGISIVLVAAGGLLGLAGIQNPRRRVESANCAGGQLAGHPREAAGC